MLTRLYSDSTIMTYTLFICIREVIVWDSSPLMPVWMCTTPFKVSTCIQCFPAVARIESMHGTWSLTDAAITKPIKWSWVDESKALKRLLLYSCCTNALAIYLWRTRRRLHLGLYPIASTSVRYHQCRDIVATMKAESTVKYNSVLWTFFWNLVLVWLVRCLPIVYKSALSGNHVW